MTLRCALYARYSSDQQRAASIEDQFRVCRERAGREGWKIAGACRSKKMSTPLTPPVAWRLYGAVLRRGSRA